MAQPGEYDRTVRVRRRCGLMSNYFDHLFNNCLAGGMPGPVLFGFAMDHSCLLWEKKCDGGTGACLYYDNHQMAWILLAVCASCKLLGIVCSLIGWQMYVYKQSKGDGQGDRFEITLTVGQAGNSETGNNYASNEDVAAEVHDDQ